MDLAATLDFHSVGYRGHISCDIEKSEQFHFRLTAPNTYSFSPAFLTVKLLISGAFSRQTTIHHLLYVHTFLENV